MISFEKKNEAVVQSSRLPTTKMTICVQNRFFPTLFSFSFNFNTKIFANTSYEPMMQNTLPFKWGGGLQSSFVIVSRSELSSYICFAFQFSKDSRYDIGIAVKAISKFIQTHLSNSTGRTIRRTRRLRFDGLRCYFACKSGYFQRQCNIHTYI